MPVAIAGMRRSGASLVARTLNVAGLELGPERQLRRPVDAVNDGAWEHVEFVELNERILRELGGGWDYPPPANGAMSELGRRSLGERAKELVQQFEGVGPWGWKDPQNSLTLPFWVELVDDLDVVVCLRNPLEVAVSLESRNALSQTLGLELWKAYYERILAATTPDQRVVTHFDAYMTRPADEVRRLLGVLGFPAQEDVVERAASTIEPSLRHARFTRRHLGGARVPQGVADLYAQLQVESGWDDSQDVGRRSNGAAPRVPAAAAPRAQTRVRETVQRLMAVPEPSEADPRSRREALRAQAKALRADIHADDFFGRSRTQAYAELVERHRQVVDSTLPADACLAVISRGDDELLKLGHRSAHHFPATEAGLYAGAHPIDSAEAVAALDALRRAGAEYLVFPNTAFWWLDHYEGFRAHLERSCRLVARRDDTCWIYAVSRRAADRVETPASGLEAGAPLELDEVELRLEVASLLFARGDVTEATRVLEDGLALDATQPRLHAAMVRCAARLGDPLRANEHAARAADHAGDNVTALRELSDAALGTGKLSLAERSLTQLAALVPDDPLVANSLVVVLCERVVVTPGRQVVDRLADQATRLPRAELLSPETLFRTADVLERLDRRDAAIECLAAIARKPIDQGVRWELAARLLRQTGLVVPTDEPAALAALLTTAGHAFTALDDDVRAELCWRLARAEQPENAAPAFNLAWRAIATGRPLEALEQLVDSAEVDADEAALIAWPRIGDRLWPATAPPSVDAFDDLKPVDAPWPRITVVTTCFQQAAVVEQTILSVLNQQYPDVEYVVVDRGSTDGSKAILRRYERRLSRLIVEPGLDHAAALNEGLRVATGELVTWVDPDAMLAPGALFALAAGHLSSGADLVAGFGLEHVERQFDRARLPALSAQTFNVARLGSLFDHWLKTDSFRAGQAVLTRRLLERVGAVALAETREAMEYEFWLRCAAAGATVSVAPAPTALLSRRRTAEPRDVDAVVIEQAKIRNRYLVPRPAFARVLDVRTRLRRGLSQPTPRVRVVSARASKIFAAGTGHELDEAFRREGLEVTFHEELDLDLAHRSDLLVVLVHLMEAAALRELREAGCELPIVGWTWDNHHDVRRNYRSVANVDVLMPGHAFAAEYLESSRYVTTEPVPLCTTQWTVAEAKQFFADLREVERRDSLYGGFVRYAFAEKRNALVEELQAAGMAGVAFVEEDSLETYFGLSPRERFAQWASHKASLCLPLSGDLSQRFFDALLTGQVPIVPPDLHDLDAVVPPAVQRRLPIVRVREYTAAAVQEAHAVALRLYDRDGAAGARRRHRYALTNHMVVNRLHHVVRLARNLAGIDAPTTR